MIRIQVHKQAEKGLQQAPKHVQEKFLLWVELLTEHGLLHTRKRLGFHDEPLQGRRKGQRSVRLNKQWRIIYKEIETVIHIEIIEVTPHDYR